jgi:hypothetical protein
MTAILLPAERGTMFRRAMVRSVVPIMMARAEYAAAEGRPTRAVA